MRRASTALTLLLCLLLPVTAQAAELTYGTAVRFFEWNAQLIGVARIDDTHVLVVHGIASSNGVAVVGTVSGNAITFGSGNQFSAGYAGRTDVAMLDSTHAVIAYTDGAGYDAAGKVVIATISGDTVTFGTPASIGENVSLGSNKAIEVTALDATHFVVSYVSIIEGGDEIFMEPDIYSTKVKAGTVSGTSITLGSASTLYSGDGGQMAITTLDSTHFAVAWSGEGKASVGSVSGTSISLGTAVSYGSGTASIAAIDSTHFLLNYTGSGRKARVATVSGTSISYGTELTYAAGSSYENAIAVLSATRAVVFYGNTAVDIVINGTTLTAGDSATYGANAYAPDAVALSSGKLVAIYENNASSYSGWAVVGADLTGPSPVTGLVGDSTGDDVSLSWDNPTNADFSSVTIRRSTTSYPATVSAGSAVVSGSTSTSYADNNLSDGTYYYSVFAMDTAGNASTAAQVSVTVDATTSTPTLTAPATSAAVTRSGVRIAYTLPETPQASSVTVNFHDGGSTNVTMTLGNGTSGDFTVDLTNIASAAEVISTTAASVPNGTYTVTLSYQDAAGNTAATAVSTGIVVSTPAASSSSSSSSSQEVQQSGGGRRGSPGRGGTAPIITTGHKAQSSSQRSTSSARTSTSQSALSSNPTSAQAKIPELPASPLFVTRTCSRVSKWFVMSSPVRSRVNARLQKYFGFSC